MEIQEDVPSTPPRKHAPIDHLANAPKHAPPSPQQIGLWIEPFTVHQQAPPALKQIQNTWHTRQQFKGQEDKSFQMQQEGKTFQMENEHNQSRWNFF